MPISERKRLLRETILDASEQIMAAHGIGALKARDIARAAGCSLGAIYTVFTDIDDLVLAVNSRTLTRLEAQLSAYPEPQERLPEAAISWMVSLSLIYLDFASQNRLLWRAVFEHRMAARPLPEEQARQHQALFAFIERPLEQLMIENDAEARMLLARSLFSAVHGIVALGLEEKLTGMSMESLKQQIRIVVSASTVGLLARAFGVAAF